MQKIGAARVGEQQSKCSLLPSAALFQRRARAVVNKLMIKYGKEQAD